MSTSSDPYLVFVTTHEGEVRPLVSSPAPTCKNTLALAMQAKAQVVPNREAKRKAKRKK